MVEYLKKHREVEHLLVEKTDRLYRNLADRVTIGTMEWLFIHLIKEGEILSKESNSHQKLIHDIKLVLAKNYIDNLKEEITKGQNKKAEQGGWPGGAPIGYRNNKETRQVEVHQPYARYVQQLYDWYATGMYALEDIYHKAKKAGFTHHRTKRHYHRNHIYRILTNPFYYGLIRWKGKEYPGKQQPLVTKELWDQVQAVLASKNHGNNTKRNIPFLGLLTCDSCGCAITAQMKKGKYIYYHCTKYHGKATCDNDYIRQEALDEKLAETLAAIQLPDEVAEWMVANLKRHLGEANDVQERVKADLQRRITRLKTRLEEAYIDKLEGNITSEFWEEKSKEWQAELTNLQVQLRQERANDPLAILDNAKSTIELSQNAHVQYFRKDWGEKRRVLQRVLSNCTYYHKNLYPVYKKPFDILAEGTKSGDWWRRGESNPRPKVLKERALHAHPFLILCRSEQERANL